MCVSHLCFFFFQAEDGIRDDLVTGVQTCALPIYPSTSPQSAATQALVNRLRDTTVPQMRRATGAQVHIGAPTAVFDDLGHTLTNKLPLFIGVVVLLSPLLLLAVFRSVVPPLKAVPMNVLALRAAPVRLGRVHRRLHQLPVAGARGDGPAGPRRVVAAGLA